MMNATMEAWDIIDTEFPAGGTSEEKLQFLVRYAILAPSQNNTQPWLFRIRGAQLELFSDRARALRVTDPEDRQLIMSCGAALFQLRVALLHYGYMGQVQVFPDAEDPDLVARIGLGFRCEPYFEESVLFHSIPKRRTNRLPYRNEPVPEALLWALEEAARKEGAWLHIIEDEGARCSLAGLVGRADRLQWASRDFRRELATWLHPNRTACRDGIPGYAQGINALMSYAEPLVVRTFDLGEGQAARDRDIALYSPVLAVLGTTSDSPTAWVTAGEALARVLLRARVEDVWASFLNQPIEVPELRPCVAKVIGRAGYPQIILRLGFADEVRPTPRREVDEFLI